MILNDVHTTSLNQPLVINFVNGMEHSFLVNVKNYNCCSVITFDFYADVFCSHCHHVMQLQKKHACGMLLKVLKLLVS